MVEVILFFEDSTGKRQEFRFPEMPEIPRGSLFNLNFDVRKLDVQKGSARVNFYNTEIQDNSAFAMIQRSEVGIDIVFRITEMEIRSYSIFKDVKFNNIPVSDIEKGFKLGIEVSDKKALCHFSPKEVKELLADECL